MNGAQKIGAVGILIFFLLMFGLVQVNYSWAGWLPEDCRLENCYCEPLLSLGAMAAEGWALLRTGRNETWLAWLILIGSAVVWKWIGNQQGCLFSTGIPAHGVWHLLVAVGLWQMGQYSRKQDQYGEEVVS
jgi:hypothetical protein